MCTRLAPDHNKLQKGIIFPTRFECSFASSLPVRSVVFEVSASNSTIVHLKSSLQKLHSKTSEEDAKSHSKTSGEDQKMLKNYETEIRKLLTENLKIKEQVANLEHEVN
jgi:hypothetical protein